MRSGSRGPAAQPRLPPDVLTTSLAVAPPRRGETMRRIDLLGVDEVGDGEMKMAWVDGTDQVLVINQGGEFTAVQGVCSHEYFELDKGFLTNGTLTCALHLSRFDLSNGEPLDPPAEEPLAVYPVVVDDGRVLIEVPDGPLEISES
jgi:3-phenylpropionate/trans-cinnamate dioxygenase ferredoxin component